jgi:hypothetical protein
MATYRTCYIGIPLHICGLVLLGAAFEKHLSVGAVVIGRGLSLAAVIVITVPICEFLYPHLIRENSMVVHLRCVRQRLLPKVPGRDCRTLESCACARWFRRSVLPSAMGDQTRSDADTWLRGCVSHLFITRACKMSEPSFAPIIH